MELYDDFAHHPTEIRRTIAGLQALSDSGRLLVVLEPRSNTMKRGVHRDQLAGALQRADQVWLFRPEGLDWDLAAAVDSLDSVSVCDGIDAIVAGVVTAARAGDKVVVMSNGDFQDIHRKLEAALVNSPG